MKILGNLGKESNIYINFTKDNLCNTGKFNI